MLVQRGDIGIVNNGSINKHTQTPLKGDHAFIIAGSGELKRDTATVHLTWGGLEEWDYEHQGAAWICKCPNQQLAGRACDFAEGWVKARKSPTTDYSKERAQAVMHDIGRGGDLPFEFDALRRALKWSRRKDTPFTTKAGLTCAAWVVASYQAAAFSAPQFDADALDEGWRLTAEQRALKKDLRANLPPNAQPKYREYSNPGATADDAMKQILDRIRPEQTPADGWLESLLTAPLVVDARFLHTDGLYRRLKASSWDVVAAPKF